jgi:hypothetical protein
LVVDDAMILLAGTVVGVVGIAAADTRSDDDDNADRDA